jgi:choline monooxygenase
MKFQIDPDIRKAETLPASFYKDTAVFEEMREKVFYPAWHWLGDKSQLTIGAGVTPFQLLDGFLDEPLIITRDKEERTCALTNICTHRANLISHNQEDSHQLICKYHGRRFALDGSFMHMPEFKEASDFPRACDDLHQFDLASWGPFLFTSLQQGFSFAEIQKELDKRVGFLPLNEFKALPEMDKDYLVNAHWALYCDNYLEGFHIPFVHADLNSLLDYGA